MDLIVNSIRKVFSYPAKPNHNKGHQHQRGTAFG